MPHDECPMAIALKERRAVRGIEAIAERPDGSRIWFQPYPTPLFDDSGNLVGGINMLVDITERKRAEEATAHLAEIVKSSEDAIISKNLNGIIRSWNNGAERLFGYTADEIIGKPVTTLIPADHLNEEPEILARLRRGERIDRYETVRRRKNGTLVDISLTVSPVRNSAGQIIAAAKIARDITERKRDEKALREADRRKNEFLAMLAHELRNPLAPIRNAVQILRLKGQDETVKLVAETMERQVNQLVRMVDDLLDVNRISQGKIELRTTRVELASIVRQAVEAVRPMCESKDHELSVTLPERPVYLDADPARLAQVLSNLLNNACKFTNNGGQITLTVQRQADHVAIRVRDNGIGIAADQLARVFDLFAQVDASLERSGSGLGIGLTIVKNLVEMQGGTVEAYSEGIGQGSEFVVRFPVSIATPEPCSPVPAFSKPAKTIARRILVVDDNRDSAKTLAMLLKATGHETHVAFDGLEAVKAAESFRPEVVLLDIGLPKLNGYETSITIREQPWGKDMLLVALTGWGQDDDRQKSKDAGFDVHLVKPVDYAVLTKLLAEPRPQPTF
jgi:two-component system, chemotaxis family, CheB/CheR fusion protein